MEQMFDAYSQLNTSISCLTYGINCLFFDRQSNKLRSCLLSIHEEYINIIHVIVEEKASFLFELQNVKNISDKDIYIKQTLKTLGYGMIPLIYSRIFHHYLHQRVGELCACYAIIKWDKCSLGRIAILCLWSQQFLLQNFFNGSLQGWICNALYGCWCWW